MLYTLFSLAVLSLVPTSPLIDIIPKGYHSVSVDRSAEIDPLRDFCCVQYAVQTGDTLYEIAGEQLGNAKRFGEILALNPGIQPQRLRVNHRIWLPPRRSDLEGPRRFVYLSDFMGFQDASPYTAGQWIHGRYGTFTLVVVPDELRKGVEDSQEEGGEVEAFVEKHEIKWFVGNSVGSLVKDGSKVARITELVRVVRSEDGKFAVESEVKRYDENGRLLADESETDGYEDREASAAWLLLLTGAGAAFVWWRVRSRNPNAVSEQAAA